MMPKTCGYGARMKRIIALASTKGGVGKTTIALNLAADLTRRGSTVVLLDADPAGHAAAVAEIGALPFKVMPLPLEELEARPLPLGTRRYVGPRPIT